MATGQSPQGTGSVRRRSSAYQPHNSPSNNGSVRRLPSSAQPKAQNGSARITVPKRPLQPDMSFGNSGSTMRLFRRVPSDGSTTGQIGPSDSPDSTVWDENPRPTTPAEASSKEAILGRRLYAKALDPALTELHAQTSGMAKREALAKLSDALSLLDAVDPEGAYHLVQNLVSGVSQDQKLNAAFLGGVGAKGASAGTPQVPKAAQAQQTPPAPPGSPTKLVLASNNPHLKSHRRRQGEAAAPEEAEKAEESRYPGREAAPGMEHCRQLSDVLYSRWADGLRLRWPAV